MTGSVRPRTASVLVGCAGVLALTAALSACGSKTATVNPGGPNVQSSVIVATSATSAPSASSAPSAGASSAAPSIPVAPSGGAGAVNTPKQVLGAAPAGTQLVPFLSATASADGRTVFVQLESMGGACGQYDVVLQQSASKVGVGLVHLSSAGHICPQYVGPLRVAVSLAAPLAGRPLVDLANDQSLNVG